MHPPEEGHQLNRILASFSPLSYQQQDNIALCSMVSKDQYDTIPATEDTTLLASSLTPPDEDNPRSSRRNMLTTFGAAILVIIGVSVVAKSGCPHKMPVFQAMRGGKPANIDMLGLGQTEGPTVSPTLSPTLSPTVSPTLSPTVSPVAKD